MMGVKGTGEFNDEDMAFTTNITSYQKKKEKTIAKIKERSDACAILSWISANLQILFPIFFWVAILP